MLVVFSTIAVLAARVHPGRLSLLPGLRLLTALRQSKILRGSARQLQIFSSLLRANVVLMDQNL